MKNVLFLFWHYLNKQFTLEICVINWTHLHCSIVHPHIILHKMQLWSQHITSLNLTMYNLHIIKIIRNIVSLSSVASFFSLATTINANTQFFQEELFIGLFIIRYSHKHKKHTSCCGRYNYVSCFSRQLIFQVNMTIMINKAEKERKFYVKEMYHHYYSFFFTN